MTRAKEKAIFSRSFRALGTDVEVRILAANGQRRKAEQDLVYMPRFYQKQEMIFSRFDRQSELSRLNRRVGQTCQVSSELRQVAALSLHYHRLSDGLFDPRILSALEQVGYENDYFTTEHIPWPDGQEPARVRGLLDRQLAVLGTTIRLAKRMDFSGIAKGFITDKATEYLSGRGWKDFLVDSGGDMFLAGRNQAGKEWVIEMEGAGKDQILLSASGQAIATSGISRRKWEHGGRRFHHLINPKDLQRFQFGLRLVTVIADSVTEADVWAKVLFLMGREKGLEHANDCGLKAIFQEYSGKLWISESIKSYLYQK